ncbi:NAD dependent epimerase/dehydratase [Westerdykella ornata]|uniref:NAD dependent epimerase/dehydratase n=1 Tax=Westerdykella ornata TaxID=318751 RepID=A0A6A6J6R2_WESOR|nr:NAD dependent epimerase/dehydratase [Westerdykella ornata]KAF2272261.1 NAD dependent epimerase/dehydratase [Westerdykella ornata]
MASELVLLTGATGLIGFRVLVFCLRKGYRVRVALRTLDKKARILNAPSVRDLGSETNLTFVEIPDISIPGAFDEALQDVDYVIHVAAPIVSTVPSSIGADLARHYFKATTDAALHLLSSAKAHHTVKRIILTNSLAALFDYATDTDETIHTESTRATNIQQPPYSSPFEAYTAAKVSTLNLTEQWVESEKPSFDLVHIAPGHVFGPNELVTDPEELLQTGTNRIILLPVTGRAYPMEAGVTAHLDDVAEAHIRALNPAIPGNRLYILSSGGVAGIKLDDCFEIVARNFPEHVGSTLPNNGSLPSYVFKVDAGESARILGINFIPYEQQVRDVVGYYLECVQHVQQQRSSTTSD